MEKILCRVVESSCLPTHNNTPHISLHDPPIKGVCTHACSRPSRVRRRLFLACIGDASPVQALVHVLIDRASLFTDQRISSLESPETVPICIVWQYYPHDNIVCIHMCDEYKKSIDSSVCHRLWSILCEGCLVVGSDHGPQAEVAQGVGPGPLVEL